MFDTSILPLFFVATVFLAISPGPNSLSISGYFIEHSSSLEL